MAWKQTGLVGTPYWEEDLSMRGHGEKKTEPEQGALESTLELVKKSLWTLERHTQSTSARLDKNNQSGPSYPLYQISKWGESAVLDMMLETIVELQDTLENSAIARKSDSPLEKSLDNIKESTVSFNEQTMRWHDDQTNLMVKKSDPRVAEAMKPEPSALETAVGDSTEMVTEKKVGLGVLAGFLKDIATDTLDTAKAVRLIVHKLYHPDKISAEDEKEGVEGLDEDTRGFFAKLFGKSAEDKKEGKVKSKNAAKEEQDQGNSLKGIWGAMKERAKKNWLVQNWGKILAGLVFLFAPLKWIKNIWEFFSGPVWDFTKKHPLIATILLIGTWILGPLNIIKIGLKVLGKTLVGGFKILKGIPGFIKGIPVMFKSMKLGMSKAWGRMKFEYFKKGGLQSKLRTVGNVAKKGASSVVSGVKAVGSKAMEVGKAVGSKTMEVGKVVGSKLGDMASSTKGIFGSLVKKFGSAGKWIMKLGSKLIMPLVTTPLGWAILAGLAIGALAYIFWDDIKKTWGKITGFISGTFSKVAEFAKNMVGSAKTMLGNFLRSVGAGMIADWIDPDGADKSKPAKEFTWGGFAEELWAIYSGIWKKIFGAVKKMAGAIGNFGIAVLKGLGAPEWLINMLGGGKKKEPEKVEQPSGEVTEKTDKSRRGKFKKDFKARAAAEEKGYIDQSFWTGGIASINREAMTRDLNNGELTRDMLVAMLDSGDLSKKKGKKGAVDETASDYEYVETALKLFPAPKPTKAEVVTTEPPKTDTATLVKTPPREDFKTPIEGMDVITDYRDWKKSKKSRSSLKKAANKKEAITNLVDMLKDLPPSELEATVAKLNPKEITAIRTSGLAKDLESKHPLFKKKKSDKEVDLTTGQGPADVEAISARINKEQAAFKKGGWAEVKKLRAAQSPDDNMNMFNSVQEKNRTLQQGQSGSTTIMNTTNAQSTNTKQGDLIASIPSPVRGKTVPQHLQSR